MIEDEINKGRLNSYCASEPVVYALSSGSVGVPKHVPVSAEALKIYSDYTVGGVFYKIRDFIRRNGIALKPGLSLSTLEAN